MAITPTPQAKPSPSGTMTIPDALNEFARHCMNDPRFRDFCCRRWQAFDDDRIGDEIADYARETFPLIGLTPTEAQLEAMRRFPKEGLRLLRSFVVQFLTCPRPDGSRLQIAYDGIRSEKSVITIGIDEDNVARVTFRAPVIP
jgi:hypothetical protein